MIVRFITAHKLGFILLIIFVLIKTEFIFATDLKFSRLITPRVYENVNTNVFTVVEIENANVLTANNWSVSYNIVNSNGQIIFQSTIQGISIEPFTKTILESNVPFLLDSIGIYTINLHINFADDIDTSNNDMSFEFEIIQLPPGIEILPGNGVKFHQINFTFSNAMKQNSTYGMFVLNFDVIANTTNKSFGYINVYSLALGWFIQNMIFDASLQLVMQFHGLSTFFNLENLQTPTNQKIDNLDAFVFLTDNPIISDFKTADFSSFTVDERPYNAQGVLEPKGTIPAPLKFENIPFIEGGKDDLVWQHRHVSIEQDKNQCAPGAVANSFQWLENEKGINIPNDHKSGIRDSSLIGQLDKAMNRDPHNTVSFTDLHTGKLKYISDNNLSDKLIIKHKNRKGKTYLTNDTLKVGSSKSIPNTDTTLSLVDWMLEELKHGEDVEMVILWDGGGGHVVDLIGGGYVQGVPWLSWVHDANQGFDDNGTPANTADDKVKNNGGISPDSGGVGWSYIIDNKLVSVVGGDTSKGTIAVGLSESKDSTVTDIKTIENGLPNEFKLKQNFPNPFNPSTIISYQLSTLSFVTLKVYDALGREVAALVNKEQPAGNYKVNFDATNLTSGIYFYRIVAGSFIQTKKMILLK